MVCKRIYAVKCRCVRLWSALQLSRSTHDLGAMKLRRGSSFEWVVVSNILEAICRAYLRSFMLDLDILSYEKTFTHYFGVSGFCMLWMRLERLTPSYLFFWFCFLLFYFFFLFPQGGLSGLLCLWGYTQLLWIMIRSCLKHSGDDLGDALSSTWLLNALILGVPLHYH